MSRTPTSLKAPEHSNQRKAWRLRACPLWGNRNLLRRCTSTRRRLHQMMMCESDRKKCDERCNPSLSGNKRGQSRIITFHNESIMFHNNQSGQLSSRETPLPAPELLLLVVYSVSLVLYCTENLSRGAPLVCFPCL